MTREDAVKELKLIAKVTMWNDRREAVEMAIEALSAEVVQGWKTDKPTESGKYMATLDAWGRRYIALMHYGKPQLPSREVDGVCWYMCDSEWGDVVYDDKDILAWMPLPDPYKEGVK